MPEKSLLDERTETITQIAATLVAALRCSPAEGAEMARLIIEQSMRVARDMAAERESDPRAAGAAMVQRRAAQHQS